MLAYLIVLWVIVTLAWSGSKSLRHSGVVFTIWFLLTAVVLYPVVKRVQSSPLVQATYQQASREINEDIRRDMPEFFEDQQQEVSQDAAR